MSTEKVVNTTALKNALKFGADNGQSAETLAFRLDTIPRVVRNLMSELRKESVPVCAHPKTGYFIAQTQAEVDSVAKWLHSRAMHSLVEEKNLRNAWNGSGVDPIQQLEEAGAFES